MHLHAAKRMLRLLLPLYFAVFSVMPLSNIHLENLKERSSYLGCKAGHDIDLHLILHEMLFTHFGNKSEHLKNSPPARFVKNKEASPKDHLRFAAAADISASSDITHGEKLTPPDDEKDAQHCLCFSFTGLSPPSA